MGENLYSIECLCISKSVLIQHILRTQVSDIGPLVLWFNTGKLSVSEHRKNVFVLINVEFV